ncbi:D-hexose-6-phosphate mutarotase [Colwelliaceae bacterium 6471]
MSSVIKANEFGQVSEEIINEFARILCIEHPACRARLSLYGGQVLSWQPKEQDEVFWLSKSADYKQGRAVRGGIPLCWPWFGDFNGAGNHGFARQSHWQLEDISLTKEAVVIVLSLQGNHCHELWPNRFALQQVLTFGEEFSQTLSMTNLSDDDVKYTAALHSYFNVSSPLEVRVDQLSAVNFDDKLTAELQVSAALDHCAGPIDRIYYCDVPMKIEDKGLNRVISIIPLNTKQWVLWNPGIEGAQAIADIHDHGEQEYVCLEAANTQWQVISPNETLKIGQHISVSSY